MVYSIIKYIYVCTYHAKETVNTVEIVIIYKYIQYMITNTSKSNNIML